MESIDIIRVNSENKVTQVVIQGLGVWNFSIPQETDHISNLIEELYKQAAENNPLGENWQAQRLAYYRDNPNEVVE